MIELFSKLQKIRKACMEEKLHLFKLIGDATYLVRLWMYYLFKEKSKLSQIHANWNSIQFSTQMCRKNIRNLKKEMENYHEEV